jgi:hypothetical protein
LSSSGGKVNTMTQWEYARVTRLFDGEQLQIGWVGPDGRERNLPDEPDVLVPLSDFGADGWELVAVTETQTRNPVDDGWSNRQSYHLKREVPEPPMSRRW